MNEETDLLLVSNDEVGERLDKILSTRFKERYSRTYFQNLIDQHLVLVNGDPVPKRMKLQSGDEIEVQFTSLPGIQLVPEPIPLSILFEDEHILAINKPTGMVVHPAPGNWNHTFVHALLHHCVTLPHDDSIRPGIVHRIDKDTSGILIAAKTLEAQQKLIALFSMRQIEKEYLAVCLGKPAEGEIHAPIGRHPIHRKQMAIVPNGKEAISLCKVISWNEKLSVVSVKIATGRTHQIRVHLKYRGTPILGDSLYGNPSLNQYYSVHRQLLHAIRMSFFHPITHKKIELHAPVPFDMQKVINKIH